MVYIDRGGIIVYILLFLNVIGFALMLWKLIQLSFTKSIKAKIVINTLDELKGSSDGNLHTKMKNSIDLQIKNLEFGLNFVKIIATIAPLLGLLGTVIGVLSAFDSISVRGLGDNSIFAGGISVALITTVAGLIVAIPHLIGYNFFISKLDKIELEIEKELLSRT
jgi:biopolymer transport protein ExbB